MIVEFINDDWLEWLEDIEKVMIDWKLEWLEDIEKVMTSREKSLEISKYEGLSFQIHPVCNLGTYVLGFELIYDPINGWAK